MQSFIETSRCITCGHPSRDHLAFRYWFRPWIRHRILRWLDRMPDTLAYF